jgi:hypothetical protein
LARAGIDVNADERSDVRVDMHRVVTVQAIDVELSKMSLLAIRVSFCRRRHLFERLQAIAERVMLSLTLAPLNTRVSVPVRVMR